MPFTGRITHNVNSNNSYVLQNPDMDEYDVWTEVEDTITIRSTNGRPFTFRGYYSIGGNDIFALYMGNTMDYPLEGYHSGSGYIDIYCYSGAITLYYFHSPYSGEAWSMSYDICFPEIYDVHVERTNCNYTNVYSLGGDYSSKNIYYRSLDEGQQFTVTQSLLYNPDSIYYNITAGKRYIYYVTDLYNDDTTNHCSVPPHYFRTPKQQDCNSCEHYKNCLDYTKLSGTKQATCYKGSSYRPDATECMVDDGPNSSTSQHTVHTDTNARDANTNNQLRPIPRGDTASVRLGNWSTGSEGESILYEIHVDTNDYDLMMLKYAVVFLDPELEGEQQPRFSIRLTDENCIPIEPLCYSRDIFPRRGVSGWNVGASGSGHSFVWHDWWTMGINLSSYHGKIIYLQLYTYDGAADGAAYVYFTLHCARKQIDHLQQCGDAVANTFYAPEGFRYRWFNVDSSNVTLSSQQMLSVSDSGLYRCWVMPTDCPTSSCGFYINALSSPRYPHARFEHVDSIGTCMFKVRFVNRSYISAGENDTVPLWTNEDCETAYWDFGNGETSTNYNAETIYRAAGTYNVKLITTIAGGACADTTIIPVVLHWTHPAPYITGNNTLCPGNMTQLTIHNTQSQKWLLPNTSHPPQSETVNLTPNLTQHTFVVNCAITDDNGCKDTLHFPIYIHDQYNTHESRTICQAQLENGWTWRGHTFYEGTTTNQYYYPDTTVNGCDSNVTLYLIVNETFHRYQTYVFCDYTTSFPYPPLSPNPVAVYDSVGEYDYVFHTALNCDSIIHLTLRKHIVDHDTIWDNVCSGYAYDTLDFHLTGAQNATAGTTIITHTATEQAREQNQIQTCDSTMTLVLTVNPQSQSQRSMLRNENSLPVTFNGVDFYNNADTVFHLTNRYGCDSALHFTLAINFNTSTHYYDTICESELPYTWDGITFDSACTVTTTLQRPNGADSLIMRHLTVYSTYTNTTWDTICDSETATFCGTTYSVANTYTHNLTSINNCDSVETLVLTVHATYTTALEETICSNDNYNFNGDEINTTGIYDQYLHSIHGCDSMVTLNLTAIPTSESTIRDTILENQLATYTFLGHSFLTDVEDTVIVITNHLGCDSMIHFWLYINWNQMTIERRNICRDQISPTYDWDGTTFYYVSGITDYELIDTLAGSHGTDSIVTRRLHVNPTYNQEFAATICDDTSYMFGDSLYVTAGNYTHELMTTMGCDSTVTLHLTVNAVTHSIFDTTILENTLSTYTFNGRNFTSDVNNEPIVVTNRAGCDSVISFTLHVIPNVSNSDTHIICQSELPHLWNGVTFNAEGTETINLYTSLGADSIVTMRLYVNPTYYFSESRTICDNQSTVFNGVTITADSLTFNSQLPTFNIIDTLATIHQCDSITHLTLTINPTHTNDFYDTTCNNHPYTFGGSIRSEEGDHVHTFMNAYQCDSTVTLHLHIDSVTHSVISEELVENDLPHTFNGVTYLGNDVSSSTPQNPSTSAGQDSVNVWGMTNYQDTIVISNHRGCDSVIYHRLTINWNQHTTVYHTICNNQFPFDWDGTIFTATDYNGIDTVIVKDTTLTNIDGADSVVTRRLHINPTYATSFSDTICNDVTYSYNLNSYDTTGNYTNLLQSIDNCDSVVTLMLTVNAVTYSDLYDTIVENQLPYTLNGETYMMSQTQAIAPLMRYVRDTVTITNAKHCDSIIDLRLYVHLNVYDTVDSTICDNYLPMQWNHRTFTDGIATTNSEHSTLIQLDTLTAWTGADSILTMRLHVNPTYDLHYSDTICSNEEVTFNGSTYNTPGDFPHLMTSLLSCDSLETLHLTVLGTSAANIADTIVENHLRQGYTFNGVLFDTLLYEPEHQVAPHFSRRDSTIVITNQIGCDSTIHFSLNVHWNVSATADSTICENNLPLLWNHRTFTSDTSTLNTQHTHYILLDTLTAWTGADSVLTMRLHVDTNSSSHIPDTVLENTLPYSFNGITYTLSQMEIFRDSIADLGIQNAISFLDTITIANNKGCDSVIHHALFIRWNKTTDLYDTICENYLPYTWQGGTVSVDSTTLNSQFSTLNLIDTAIYTAAGGEDSLVVMHLHVKRNSNSTIYDTIIENAMNHHWNGVTFTWDDTVEVNQQYANLQHTGIISNAAGCDSIADMNLTVWLNRTASADSNVCENYFPFEWNGTTFTATSGTPAYQSANVMLSTTHGADSLLTMNVTEWFNSYSSASDTIVENSLAWNFNGALIDHSHFGDTAAYRMPPSSLSFIDSTVVIANILGCDSLINYRLNVWWNVRTDSDDTVCESALPLTWNERTFTLPYCQSEPIEGRWHRATLYDTMPAWSGADSIVAMHLHVMPSYTINFNDTVCQSSYIAWYGDTLYETGVYPMAFQTIDGCDSTEYLHFANYPNYDLVYYDTICDYSGIMRLGVEYIGMAHIPTMHGCDSNEIYHLWGMPVNYNSVDTIVSEHQIPFAYNGEWFADSGTSQQQFVLTNQYGCDSIINFTITVMPTVRQILDSSVCDVMLPLDWDGTVFSATGETPTYTSGTITYQIIDTLPGAYGADSIVTRRLHVSPSYNLTYVDTTCSGAPYPFGDSNYSTTGVYQHLYTTTSYAPLFGVACDSIETLHLQVNAMSYATYRDTIVENQLPHTFGGVTFTTTDEIIDSTIIILNTVACDSVITYSLHVYPNSYVNKDTTLCDNELPFVWDGITVSHSGLDSVIVLMPDGTDSVTRYWTVVNSTYHHTDTVRVCDSYSWIDGNTYTTSTSAGEEPSYHMTSMDGCDSIHKLQLTIDYQTTTHDSIQSCDPYTWIDSVTYSISISGPTHLLKTVHGCDSTVILEFNRVNHVTTNLFDTICRGVRYGFGGNEYSETGTYSDSLQTMTGCDSVVLLNLHVLEPPTIDITKDYDCDTRLYTITGDCNVPWFEWSSFPDDPSLTGQEHNRTIVVRPTTHETYLLTADYKDVPTCPSSLSINLSPLLKPHAQIEYTPEFLTYDQLHMSAISRCTNEETRFWTVNGNDMGDHERISYLADPRTDDSVVVLLTAKHGICYDSAMVVIPFRKAAIWAPNAFTPGESSNSEFFVRCIGITDYSIDLYTRGGVLVWHSNDMEAGWNGTYKGKPCPQDSYVWIIHYRDVTAPKNLLSKKGTVTLIR